VRAAPFFPKPEKTLRREDTLNVITISRNYGSGGTEFGKQLAERMGFQYVDAAFLRTIEKNPDGFSPLMRNMEDEVAPGFFEKFTSLMSSRSFYKTAISSLVGELALKANSVMVGGSAHLILKGLPSLISLHVIRRLSDRVKIVARQRGIPAEGALRIINSKDKDKQQFVKYYFDKELFDPSLFHLTINADFFSLEDALELVAVYSVNYFSRVDAVRSDRFLKDRLLENRALMVLFHLGMTHSVQVEFTADQGNLTARGVVSGERDKSRLLSALDKLSDLTALNDRLKVGVLSRNIY
jgi:cytidylate kinase